LGLPEEVVKLAWPKHDWAAELTPEVMHDLGAKAAFLLDQKMIQRPVNLSELVNPLIGKQ
jgi:sulfonate transport system substrate-binding protein